MKNKIFLVLRDASALIQCVGNKEKLSPEDWEALANANIENAIAGLKEF